MRYVSYGILVVLSHTDDGSQQWVSNKDDMKRLLRRLEHLQAKFQDDEADPGDSGELQRRTHLTMFVILTS